MDENTNKFEKIIIAMIGRDNLELPAARFRRDLETKNWHYYEMEGGKILHMKKSQMAYVISESI